MPKVIGSMSYTRKEYIRSSPPSIISRFGMGKNIKYQYKASLISSSDLILGSSSLEAARVTANKPLESSGIDYFLKVNVYPHEMIREHKFMGFAGADRLSQGMSKSFGKAKIRAAKVNKNTPILIIKINKDGLDIAKKSLKNASLKLSGKTEVIVE